MLPDQNNQPVKVAIVGVNSVGTAYAYALLQSGLAAQIVLIDEDPTKAQGEALDLAHAVPLIRHANIWAGNFADCAGAAITVITAGGVQHSGETVSDLAARNVALFRAIIPQIATANPDGLLLIASDPVDILTYAAWKISDLAANQVIGLGTLLETARFRHLLGDYFKVGANDVHAYIIGEHGRDALPIWSQANINGMLLSEYSQQYGLNCTDADLEAILHQARIASNEILQIKGSNGFASASGLLRITEAVLLDQSIVLCLSNCARGDYQINNICLSLPVNIGRAGVNWTLRLDLTQDETALLHDSADHLKQMVKNLDL